MVIAPAQVMALPGAAAYSEQAAVGDWPLRLALIGGFLVGIVAVLLGLRHGWNRRRAEQSGYELPTVDPGPEIGVPAGGSTRILAVKYIGTTPADDLYTRINPAGGPAQATMRIAAGGVVLELPGPAYLAVPVAVIRSVGTGKGILQKAYKRHGLLLLTWDWDGRPVTTGVWLAQRSEHEAAVELISELIPTVAAEPTHGEVAGAGPAAGAELVADTGLLADRVGEPTGRDKNE